MAIGSEYKHKNRILENAVNQTVFLGDAATPTSFWRTFEWFWMTCATSGVFHQFCEHLHYFLKSLWLIMLQLLHVQLGFIGIFEFIHKAQRLSRNWVNSSFELMRCVLPCRYSSSPLSRLAKNSSRVISVGAAFFSMTSFLAYLVRRLINGSLSAMAPMLCQSSTFMAFNCTAVISSVVLICQQSYTLISESQKKKQ